MNFTNIYIYIYIYIYTPYSKNVKTNVAQKFLRLIDKHFPKSSKLHKIFNRNSIKVSYSCMPNVKSNISSHNHRVLKKANASTNAKLCNCRDKNECPLGGKCLTSSVVYQAAITTKDTAHQTKNYIGVTAGPFKKDSTTTTRNRLTTTATEKKLNFQNTLGNSKSKTYNLTSNGQSSNACQHTRREKNRVSYAWKRNF